MNENQINNFIYSIKDTIYFKNIIIKFNPISVFLGGSVSENFDTDLSDIDIFVVLNNSYTIIELQSFYNNNIMKWNNFEVHFIFRTISTYLEPKSILDITGYAKKNILLYGKEIINQDKNLIYGAYLLTNKKKWIETISRIFEGNFNREANHYLYSIIFMFCKVLKKEINKEDLIRFKNRNFVEEKEKKDFWKMWAKVKDLVKDINEDEIKKEIEVDIYEWLL